MEPVSKPSICQVSNLIWISPCSCQTHYQPILGIIEGAKDGKGRGRQVIAVARTCNLIFIVLDVLKPLNDLAIITNELEGFGIRLNKKSPAIQVKKKETGGVSHSDWQRACSSIPDICVEKLELT